MSPNKRDEQSVPPNSSTVIFLMMTMADTTWRLFVPSVGMTILGLLLDKQFGTTPWIMAVGVVIGSTLAILLVRRQLKKVNKT